MVVIKKINNNTFDAFYGEGWDNAGRFKIKFGKNAPNQLFQIKGTRFPKPEMNELLEKYNAK